MKRAIVLLGAGVIVLSAAGSVVCAADQQEIEQKSAAIAKMLNAVEEVRCKPPRRGLSSGISVFSGYETNAKLDNIRKGDTFQGLGFFTSYATPLGAFLEGALRHNLLSHAYNEFVDNTFVLNNLSARLGHKTCWGLLGVGADVAYADYLRNDQADFLYPRTYVTLRHNFSKKYYHQIEAESVFKRYRKARAISHALNVYQDKGRQDNGLGLAYQAGGLIHPRLSFRLRYKFFVNDDNSFYQDYYDYISHRADAMMTWHCTKRGYLITNVSLNHKDYQERRTYDGSEVQVMDTYSASLAWHYYLTKATTMIFSYKYLENVANESAADYSDSIMTVNCTHKF